jgi:hypothetical protein
VYLGGSLSLGTTPMPGCPAVDIDIDSPLPIGAHCKRLSVSEGFLK